MQSLFFSFSFLFIALSLPPFVLLLDALSFPSLPPWTRLLHLDSPPGLWQAVVGDIIYGMHVDPLGAALCRGVRYTLANRPDLGALKS